MTSPCSTLRLAPSLALLLGFTGLLAGCIDPKSIGLETADDGSGSAESGSDGDASEGSGGTGQGPGTGQTNDSGDPTGGETDDGSCPPIDPAPCQECTCIDGGWICEPTCLPSCDGALCGASCELCPEGEPDCEPDQGVCTADGQCVGTPPPKLGFCEGALQPGFEDELDQIWGCTNPVADVLVFAHDMADERGLALYVDMGLWDQAIASGMPVHAELDATDPAVILEGRAGFYVTATECADFWENEPDIKEHWVPTAGTVILDLVPVGDQTQTTVQLVDVELHRVEPGPEPITIDLTWSDVLVGEVPG
jgi:hypothetical protein